MNGINRFLHNCAGGTLVWFALTLPIILGTAGIGIDAVLWYMDKRILQTAVDSSVIAGALLALQDATDAEILAAVKDEIARNDFQATPDDVIVVNVPPLSGPNAGVSGFVEVIITEARPLYFAGFVYDEPVFIQARAVSGTSGVGSHCILALDETIDAAIEFKGTANADINCGVASNSQSDSAIDLNGGAVLKADSIQAFGDFAISNNASLITTKPQPYSTRVNDPYADLEVPADSPCDETDYLITTGSVTLDAGRYCGGIDIRGANVTFNPGVYIIDAGDFLTSGTPTLTGTGVTFILTAATADDVGSVKFTGGTVADLTAPSDEGNPYAGILFYQDRDADSFLGINLVNNSFQGGTAMDLRGAIYFPSQRITFTGGSTTGDGCLQLIARQVTFSGNGNIVNGEDACEALRVKTIERLRVTLVE